MDFLCELLFEFLGEGMVALSRNGRVPGWIRGLLAGIIALVFTGVIGLMLFVGITAFEENIMLGLLIVGITVFIAVMGIVKYKRIYRHQKDSFDH